MNEVAKPTKSDAPYNQQAKAPPTNAGIKPVQLHLKTATHQPIEWDGDIQQHNELTLNRMWGTLSAGPISLKYRYTHVGILEFSLPTETGPVAKETKWFVNRKETPAGTSFRIPRGINHIIRMQPTSMRQILTITRP